MQLEPSCNMLSVGIAGKKRRHSPSGGTACVKPSDEKEHGTLENWESQGDQSPTLRRGKHGARAEEDNS